MSILTWIFNPVMDLFWQVVACEGNDPDPRGDDDPAND
jgi:hypothetical protein